MSYFDLRLPLGWLFVILGALIICAGFGAQVTSEGMSLGWNVDFLWGAGTLRSADHPTRGTQAAIAPRR